MLIALALWMKISLVTLIVLGSILISLFIIAGWHIILYHLGLVDLVYVTNQPGGRVTLRIVRHHPDGRKFVKSIQNDDNTQYLLRPEGIVEHLGSWVPYASGRPRHQLYEQVTMWMPRPRKEID